MCYQNIIEVFIYSVKINSYIICILMFILLYRIMRLILKLVIIILVFFIDDADHMTWVYLLKGKEEVFSALKAFH